MLVKESACLVSAPFSCHESPSHMDGPLNKSVIHIEKSVLFLLIGVDEEGIRSFFKENDLESVQEIVLVKDPNGKSLGLATVKFHVRSLCYSLTWSYEM